MNAKILPIALLASILFAFSAANPALAEDKIPYWGLTHTVNYADLSSGVTKELNVLHRIQFQIDGKYSHVGVVNIDQTKGTAGIEVVEPVQRATLLAGKSKDFDITGDDMSDIRVKLNSISNNLANVTLSTVPAGESKNVSSIQDEGIPITSEGVFIPVWAMMLVAAILILVAAGIWLLRKKK